MSSPTRYIKVYASPVDAAQAYKWYELVPTEMKPTNIHWDKSLTLSYDWVEGAHPASWRQCKAQLEKFWGANVVRRAPTQLECERYIDYIDARALATNFPLCDCLRQFIKPENLTGVLRMHGDLTRENVVVTPEGNTVLIDPGQVRGGLVCRELDEAKMLQSVYGWEVIKRGMNGMRTIHPLPGVRPVHIALLLTHYMRLIAHSEKHDFKCLQYAQNQLLECVAVMAMFLGGALNVQSQNYSNT